MTEFAERFARRILRLLLHALSLGFGPGNLFGQLLFGALEFAAGERI